MVVTVRMERDYVVQNQQLQPSTEPWKLHFTEAYDHSDQRVQLIEAIATTLRTPAGWQLLSTHMTCKGNKVAVGLDMEALLAR